MTDERRVDDVLHAFLADGPAEASDRVLGAALEQIERTRQRRVIRVPTRFRPMRLFPSAVAVLITVAAAGGALYLLRPGLPGAGEPSVPVVAPHTWVWRATGSMTQGRVDHSAALLRDGRVLVAGGRLLSAGRLLSGRESVSSAELYDPANGSWSATGDMAEPRSGNAAILLDDGTVLVVGEASPQGYEPAVSGSSAELYDQATASWTAVAPIPTAGGTVTRLADGRVFVAGLDGVALYDPETRSWSRTSGMITPRRNHAATLLLDGRVLVAGGDLMASGDDMYVDDVRVHTSELYDPATGTWSMAGDIGVPRSHSGVLLPDGRVLDMGAPYGGPQLGDLYDPETGEWSPVDIDITLGEGYLGDPVLLLDGTVMFIASQETVLYDPSDGSWAKGAARIQARTSGTPTLLMDGRVLVSGGLVPGVNDPLVYSAAELFGPPGP